MKKIIFTTIACLFLSFVGFSQNTSLNHFFNQYAELEGFTYIFNGKGKCLYKYLPADLKKELSSVNFTKMLSNRQDSDSKLINNLKEILNRENYELVQKTKSDFSLSETYQKVSENKDFEQITIIANLAQISIRWISGKLK
jgi:hypothetical protein